MAMFCPFAVCPAPDPGIDGQKTKGSRVNWLLILFIIVVVIVFGLGFVVKWLFWIALALFVVWIITLLVDRLRRR
jgi:hypothetical protein